MNLMEAIEARHSVRQYKDKPIEAEKIQALRAEIAECNRESGLNLQLVVNEPNAFDSAMAHYGKFSGVTDYFALIGPKGSNLDELCGYYGERLVLKAQQLGLNTCWVGMTFKKVPSAFTVGKGEKLVVVISLGYGETQGVTHKIKSASDVSQGEGAPAWFEQGVKTALLAPTAMNQQKFKLTYRGGKVEAKAGLGFFTKVDLGIVKYHFEIGAGKQNVAWA